MKVKKWLAMLLAVVMVLSLAACGAQSSPQTDDTTRVFTDSVGREVEVPAQIDKVALSGPMAQIVLFALCPDKLVGVSNAWSTEAEQYLDEKYFTMPEIGQLYGGKGELNLETLLQSGAQIVIDVGEPKGSIAEDLDALQEQTGIPFVHITATTETTGDAYRMLGDLLNMKDEAETLAAYCEKVYDRTVSIAGSVEKANVLYVTGDMGQNVIAAGSYHAEILDLLTNNLAVVDEPSSKGTGNEVSMEQILTWDPDVVIFAPESIYDTVADDAAWQSVTAIKNGAYYEVPFVPYNWMGFPPSVQRYLGMMWLSKVLYPDATAEYDLFSDVQEYYKLFYHCDLTQAQYDALVANSLGK
ncbi:MAG: ABC transporter substrate-binding protein [Oscillospiraceae bacterium]|nr:ABC transporter substrate-binding protein [Oscillospiraceae bacterium]